jgi:ECF transporter S component (folate family)
VPIALGGAILGPLWNGLISAAADIVGFMITPGQGAFFPGFTLNAFLSGFAYGLFLKNIKAMPGLFARETPLEDSREAALGASREATLGASREAAFDAPREAAQAPTRVAAEVPEQVTARAAERVATQVPAQVPAKVAKRVAAWDAALTNLTNWLSSARPLLIRTSLAAFCVTILIDAILGTCWVAILYENAYSFYFGSRLIKSLIMLPVHVVVFSAIWRSIGKYIELFVFPKIVKVSKTT